MASSPSPLLMVFSQDTTASKVQAGSSNLQEASSKSEQTSKLPRGRKPGKSSKSPLKKNKPSQRGMGVERLEKLRLQEKWGNLPAEVAGFPIHPHPHHQFQTPPPPLIPVAAGPYVVGSDLNRSGFMAPKVSSTLGGGVGNNVTTDWVGGMLETSCKELSSIPKVMQYHQYDASCCSKNNKCMNMDGKGMILGGKDKLVQSMINCHVLTGLNHGHNNVGLEMKDYNLRAMRQIYHQDSELTGMITRQASAMGERSSLSSSVQEYVFFPPGKSLKEYEFFPGASNGGSYTSWSASEQPNQYYTEAAASCFFNIPSSDYDNQYNGTTTNNAIDLSLKLSL